MVHFMLVNMLLRFLHSDARTLWRHLFIFFKPPQTVPPPQTPTPPLPQFSYESIEL